MRQGLEPLTGLDVRFGLSGVRGMLLFVAFPWRGTIQKYAKPRKYGVFAFSGLTQAHAKIRRKHAEFVVVIYT